MKSSEFASQASPSSLMRVTLRRAGAGDLAVPDPGGVGTRVVADRIPVEIGLAHSEQVPELVEQRPVDLPPQRRTAAGRTNDRPAVQGDLRLAPQALVQAEHAGLARALL